MLAGSLAWSSIILGDTDIPRGRWVLIGIARFLANSSRMAQDNPDPSKGSALA